MAGVPNVFGGATTSIPLSQLDANFNTTATLGNTAIGLGNVTTSVGNLTLTNVTISSGTSNLAAANSTAIVSGTSNVVVVSSGGNITITTNNTEVMRITTAGNVGIGTDNPQAKFDVRSQINVTQVSPNTASIQAVKGSGFGYDQNAYRAVIFGPTSGNQSVALGFDPSTIAGGGFAGNGSEIITKRITAFIVPNSGSTDWQTPLSWNGTAVSVPGSLSKGSGSFRIDHPLPALEKTHQLVHSFIEGPKADLIYRGVATLVAGKATINIDTAADMTEGTFEALCREVQCFTTNESDWVAVSGKVVGNILTIEAQDTTATSTISWMVIGERKDKHILETEWTDDNGKVIVEPLKLEEVKTITVGAQ